MNIEIRNGEAIEGPHQRALFAMIRHVAKNFDEEYMRPDDPFSHGRSFTVIEAGAELVLRLRRDRNGAESITIAAVYYDTE